MRGQCSRLPTRRTVAACRTQLLDRLDPQAVHRQALNDQRARIDVLGRGRGLLQRSDFGVSPALATTAISS